MYWKDNKGPTELTGSRRTRQDARNVRPDTRNHGQGLIQVPSCALMPFDTCCHCNLATAFISGFSIKTHPTEAYLKIRGKHILLEIITMTKIKTKENTEKCSLCVTWLFFQKIYIFLLNNMLKEKSVLKWQSIKKWKCVQNIKTVKVILTIKFLTKYIYLKKLKIRCLLNKLEK